MLVLCLMYICIIHYKTINLNFIIHHAKKSLSVILLDPDPYVIRSKSASIKLGSAKLLNLS